MLLSTVQALVLGAPISLTTVTSACPWSGTAPTPKTSSPPTPLSTKMPERACLGPIPLSTPAPTTSAPLTLYRQQHPLQRQALPQHRVRGNGIGVQRASLSLEWELTTTSVLGERLSHTEWDDSTHSDNGSTYSDSNRWSECCYWNRCRWSGCRWSGCCRRIRCGGSACRWSGCCCRIRCGGSACRWSGCCCRIRCWGSACRWSGCCCRYKF